MRSLAAGVIMALALLPLLSLSAATALDTSADTAETETGGATTAQTRDGGEGASDKLPDFNTVWVAAVVAIGIVLIAGMVRTAREHRFSANESRAGDVSKGG